jgi:hypothetical protein
VYPALDQALRKYSVIPENAQQEFHPRLLKFPKNAVHPKKRYYVTSALSTGAIKADRNCALLTIIANLQQFPTKSILQSLFFLFDERKTFRCQ